jgi:tetratricopeptide (TPR) repeat protein
VIAAAAVLAVSLASAPIDTAYRGALDLLYDGQPEKAEKQALALATSAPDDPLGPYPLALILCWRAEQQPEGSVAERSFFAQVERLLRQAESLIEKDPENARARLARGAGFGVRSRYHMMRYHKREAARDAVKMREDMLAARRLDPDCKDALFGLGLYDYFTDILPRYLKLLRLFAGIPGGDRARGFAAIEETAENGDLHATEARIQLFEIYSYWEPHPDRALREIQLLRKRYPGWPLWGLKLTEQLKDRMGLYPEAARVARELLETGDRGHANYAGTSVAMARLALGEALLLDLRFGEARRQLLLVPERLPEAPWVAARARLLAGRSLELAGDRDAAKLLYRQAAGLGDRELARRAESLLRQPIPAGEVAGSQLVARARRLEEAGRSQEALELWRQARAAWPESREAALHLAEHELLRGQPETARAAVVSIAGQEKVEPPWLKPWSWLLLGHLNDLEGSRGAAVEQYKKVLDQPCGQGELAARAEAALRRPFSREGLRDPVPSPSVRSR